MKNIFQQYIHIHYYFHQEGTIRVPQDSPAHVHMARSNARLSGIQLRMRTYQYQDRTNNAPPGRPHPRCMCNPVDKPSWDLV